MNSILKDVLGIIVLKLDVRDVLNLRATCKHINSCILGFNKYWYYQCFLRNKFDILVRSSAIKHVDGVKKKLPNGDTFIFPYIMCLSNKPMGEIDKDTFDDPECKIWKKEAHSLGLFDEGQDEGSKYESAYCRMQYLKKTESNFICPNKKHYNNMTNFHYVPPMNDVNIIDGEIINCYDKTKNYFKLYLKYTFSRNIIGYVNKTCPNWEECYSLDNAEDTLYDHFNDNRDYCAEYIHDAKNEIEDLKKQIAEKEELISAEQKKLIKIHTEFGNNIDKFDRLKSIYDKNFGNMDKLE